MIQAFIPKADDMTSHNQSFRNVDTQLSGDFSVYSLAMDVARFLTVP